MTGGAVVEILVVRDAVLDVGFERCEQVVDDRLRADGADDRERRLFERHHPARGDHVVEVGDVIAVQVRDQHRREVRRSEASSCESHQHATPGIDQVVLGLGTLARRDQRCRTGSVGRWHRPTRAQQRDGQSRCAPPESHVGFQ